MKFNSSLRTVEKIKGRGFLNRILIISYIFLEWNLEWEEYFIKKNILLKRPKITPLLWHKRCCE